MTKFVTLIALLALSMLVIVPASAVWHNGNWLTEEEYSELTDGTNVIYNPQSGVSSKYKAVDNGQNDYQYSCDLRGSIRAHTNTLTPEVLLSNDLAPNDTMKLPVLPDGSFEFTGLAYGNYTLTLLGDAGNGGQTETAKVVCGAPGGVVYPQSELLGHAVAGSDAPVVCQREIVSATYCGETIPSVTHVEYRYWVVDFDYVCDSCHGRNCNPHCHRVDNSHWSEWQTTNPHKCGQETRVVTDTPAITGGCAPEATSAVREAISKGHLSFVFSNGWLGNYEGGIFDNEQDKNLLSSIGDPAHGIVKHVSITYKDCSGNEHTIDAEEYDQITLT